MRAEQLEALLADVAAGRLAPGAALDRLRHLPFEDLPFARIDHHRALRQGQPEVVFCEGKTLEQVVAICERLEAATGSLPRHPRERGRGGGAPGSVSAAALEPAGAHRAPPPPRTRRRRPAGPILVVSAGTSDLPVAEEAAVVAEAFGMRVERLIDVGVAGLHRLLAAGERSSGRGS